MMRFHSEGRTQVNAYADVRTVNLCLLRKSAGELYRRSVPSFYESDILAWSTLVVESIRAVKSAVGIDWL